MLEGRAKWESKKKNSEKKKKDDNLNIYMRIV